MLGCADSVSGKIASGLCPKSILRGEERLDDPLTQHRQVNIPCFQHRFQANEIECSSCSQERPVKYDSFGPLYSAVVIDTWVFEIHFFFK